MGPGEQSAIRHEHISLFMPCACCILRPQKQCTEKAFSPTRVAASARGIPCRQMCRTYTGICFVYSTPNSPKEFKTFSFSSFRFLHLQYKLNALKWVSYKLSLRAGVGREEARSRWLCIQQAAVPGDTYTMSVPSCPPMQGLSLPHLILHLVQFLAFPLEKAAEAG